VEDNDNIRIYHPDFYIPSLGFFWKFVGQQNTKNNMIIVHISTRKMEYKLFSFIIGSMIVNGKSFYGQKQIPSKGIEFHESLKLKI
jgi:hypothetical protein